MRSKASVVAGLCFLLLMSSCAGDTGNGTGADVEDSEPARNVVSVGLTEYAFDMPDRVTGGTVTFEAENTGDLPHEMGFVSVQGDRTLDEVMEALEAGEPPPWMEDLAGIPVVSAGVAASMTRSLEEGQYVFLCFLPTPQGQPHVAEGMVKLFTVSGTSDAAPPERDMTITATDDGFEVPDIAAGTHTIELVNEGTEPHEFAFIAFEPGKGERDLNRWFGGGFKSETPALFPGGMQAIDPGTSVVVEMTFEPGRTYTLQDFENKLETDIVIE